MTLHNKQLASVSEDGHTARIASHAESVVTGIMLVWTLATMHKTTSMGHVRAMKQVLRMEAMPEEPIPGTWSH